MRKTIKPFIFLLCLLQTLAGCVGTKYASISSPPILSPANRSAIDLATSPTPTSTSFEQKPLVMETATMVTFNYFCGSVSLSKKKIAEVESMDGDAPEILSNKQKGIILASTLGEWRITKYLGVQGKAYASDGYIEDLADKAKKGTMDLKINIFKHGINFLGEEHPSLVSFYVSSDDNFGLRTGAYLADFQLSEYVVFVYIQFIDKTNLPDASFQQIAVAYLSPTKLIMYANGHFFKLERC